MARGRSGRSTGSGDAPFARILPRATSQVMTALDLVDLNWKTDGVRPWITLPVSGIEYSGGEHIPLFTPVGLDLWQEHSGGSAGDDLARRWHFRFSDGHQCLFRTASGRVGVYCTCGVVPCGHRMASIDIGIAEASEDDMVLEVLERYLEGEGDSGERRAHLANLCDLLRLSTRDLMTFADLNDPALRRELSTELGLPLIGHAEVPVSSVRAAMNRR